MSDVYIEKPNVVHVILSDNSGQAERFIVGKTLDEATALIDPTPAWVGKPKAKRKRRTKAEIAAGSEKSTPPGYCATPEDVPPPHSSIADQVPKKGKVWV